MRQFTPVVKFVESDDSDRLAVNAVHALQAQIRETMNTERSQKQSLGISELGDTCDRCFVRKISGLYIKPTSTFSDGWKAQIGTFGHAGLEEHFSKLEGLEVNGHKLQLHLERRVKVLEHPKLILDGSCDLFLTNGVDFGMVGDWKFQGPKVIADTQRGKVKPVYTVQMNTYGLGYEILGFPVTHTCLYALPRDGELTDAAPVVTRYDRSVAINALERLTRFFDAHDVLASHMTEEQAWERLILAQDTTSGCYTCRAYETAEKEDFFAAWPG